MTDIFNPIELEEGARSLGVPLSTIQVATLISYCELVHEANQNINLTRIPTEQFIALHILDSLSIAANIDLTKTPRLLDAGTGAGFPGVVLAIAFPNTHVLMVDSTRKKLTFIESALHKLGITNAEVLHARMEELGRDPDFREQWPLVTARAVAPLEPLAEMLLPLVSIGGVAVAFKGPGIDDEISEGAAKVKALGGKILKRAEVTIPGAEAQRTLLIIEKTSPTPQQYPRLNARGS